MIRLGEPRHYFASLPSTMEPLARLAEGGAPEGTIVVAGHQTAGRGRAGRTFETGPGSALTLSLLLRPQVMAADLAPLPLIFGVAVAEGIEAIAGPQCHGRIGLKWPNDVLFQGKKLSGLLMQSRSTAHGVAFVNFGIGINVNAPSEELPEGATSLFQVTEERWNVDDVERAVLDRLSVRYEEWLVHGSRPGLDAWTGRALFLSEPVRVDNAGSQVEGVFEGVTDDGALILQTTTGRTIIVAGDLVRGPRTTG